MNIKHAALTLNEFYKAVHQLPESILKNELEGHVQEMVASMMKSCLVRNQKRSSPANMPQQWDKLFNLN
ncbi:MAG: hypothetical protein K0S29_423 [Gammaproteobacteria bacterium]|nr:hypothetical protein [Gammaproteobacteria bacterium]